VVNSGQRRPRHLVVALLATAAGLAAAGPGASARGNIPASSATTGGAALGGLAPTRPPKRNLPKPPSKNAAGHWLAHVTITQYWPAPESWFVGKAVATPGLPGKHRIDWLYSATGLSMEGEGIGLDGKMYHIDALGNGGWVTASGHSTSPSDGWSAGAPFWRAGGYWRNGSGGVTFPLAAGGWYAGAGRRYVALPKVSFAAGASLPLRYYQSLAVDPGVIPLGSRVYVPAYRHDGHGGWFVAQDTGGAINGHHVDVFRTPPPSSSDSGQTLMGQRVYVIKPAR
jgi:3D (Asp-Asp-Asp) domain-containing protein